VHSERERERERKRRAHTSIHIHTYTKHEKDKSNHAISVWYILGNANAGDAVILKPYN